MWKALISQQLWKNTFQIINLIVIYFKGICYLFYKFIIIITKINKTLNQ